MKQRMIAAAGLLLFFAGIITACFCLYGMAYQPPAFAAEIITIDKPYPVIEVRYLEVPGPVIYQETIIETTTQVKYAPVPFGSEEELREWVDNWGKWMVVFDHVRFDGPCKNYSYAMMIDMVNDGYIASAQIHPMENHMMIAVPIYAENRFLFVEPQNGEITDIFMGSKWRTD